MNGVNDGLKGSSFDYDDSRNILQSYLHRNIYHFSAAKSMTQLQIFRDMMVSDTGDILPFYKFRDKIKDLGIKFNEVWLETEHNTAMSTTINAHRWDTIDAEYIEYTTVGDERVRPEHAILDGLTYPKNHRIWQKLTPPLDYNCRCGLKPGIAKNYKQQDADKDERYVGGLVKDTIFDSNAGVTRLIFSEEHPYFENLSTGKIKEMKYNNYGLNTIDKIQSGKLKPVSLLQSKEDYEAYWNSMTNHDKGIVLKSPIGNSILFPDYESAHRGRINSYFKQHLTKDADRYKLIANLQDIIQNPDEIWSVLKKNDKEPVTNHFIKYYQGKTLLVVTVGNEGKTMFELTESGFKTRSGLLMYRKN